MNYYQRIYETLGQSPEKEVVVWPARNNNKQSTVTKAGDLLNSISAQGNWLQKNGIKKGEKVLIMVPVGLELISGLLAVMAIGAIPVLPPAAFSAFSLIKIMRHSNITAVLTPKDSGFVHKALLRILRMKAIILSKTKFPSANWLNPVLVAPDQPALISHSSGSTGKPKAIFRSHQVLLAQHEALKTAFPPQNEQVDFPLFPNILLHNLAAGVKSVLPDIPRFNLRKLDPAIIIKQLYDEKVTTLTGNVYYFQAILQYLEQRNVTFPAVSAIGIGGSPVPENLAVNLLSFFPKASIFIIYGSSEAEPIAIRKMDEQPGSAALGFMVGTVVPSLEIKIKPAGGTAILNSVSRPYGEILVRGAHVAVPGNQWLHTGDFGYLNKTQELVLTGRLHNETMHRGIQHYQIEHVLQLLPGVKKVAARSGPKGFSLFIEGNADPELIRNTLMAHFPAEIIKEIKFRKSLPVDARHLSKLQYTKVR